MARFETPIENQQVAEVLSGLDVQSVLIARDHNRTSRLQVFVEQYVVPDTLTHETEDGVLHTYGYPRLSAIGDNGSMVHIRLHEQTVGRSVDPAMSHLAVISHVDDPNPATVLPATAQDIVRHDGTRETRVSVGQPDERALQVVESPMNHQQWGVEQALARELAYRALPLISITGNGWEYRRNDTHWEKLHDIHRARDRVAVALTRGLGYAAMPGTETAERTGIGQPNEKMVI